MTVSSLIYHDHSLTYQIDIFMKAGKGTNDDLQNENVDKPNATESPSAGNRSQEQQSSSRKDGVPSDADFGTSQMDKAAKLDIKLSPEIIHFMKV